MTGEVIKSFLVGLGFGVDDASLSKFNKALTSATIKVTALYAATKVAAAGIVYGISEISEGFEKMGYEYRIIAPAINKALQLRNELLKAYSAAGINITKVIQSSVKLNFSLAKTKFAFEAIYKSVASRFFDTLTKQSDMFRKTIYANMPKIQAVLERVVKFVFKALDATTQLATRAWSILTRIYEFFVLLDEKTDGWSTRILAVIAAWKLLNLSFLATPLGFLLAGLVAILALFDDFETWKEGGKSLFDWSSFVPVIDAVGVALGGVWKVLQAMSDAVGEVIFAFYQLFTGDYSGFFDGIKNSATAVLNVFSKLWDAIKSVGGAIGALATWGGGVISGGLSNVAANIGSVIKGGQGPEASPVSGSVQSNQTNQNLQQQTNINVIGSADASAVGKAVSSEQGKVNFDMARNMQPRVR